MLGTGWKPSVTAQAIFEAVTDGKDRKAGTTPARRRSHPPREAAPGRGLVLGPDPHRGSGQPQRSVEEPHAPRHRAVEFDV